MAEQLLPDIDVPERPSIGEIRPPFETDADVERMLMYARTRYLSKLTTSGILDTTPGALVNPSEVLVNTVVTFRKQAVQYRSIMWLCGSGTRKSKFDPAFYGLPQYEENFIYRLGQYKDAVLGIEGSKEETAQCLVPKLDKIRATRNQEVAIQAVPIVLAHERLSHAIDRIDALSQKPTITDRGIHDLRILIRVMRDVYTISDASRQTGAHNTFVKWLDTIQKACNTWRYMVALGQVAPVFAPQTAAQQDSLPVPDNGLPDKALYTLPPDIARASQEVVSILRQALTPS
ncbi:MAG TPA: hypothetical protein PKG71_02420 [Candidatus Woesebacteria bacterium]|nr:hypothetical protein [Candidatus Woesebacteria bacterium]HNS94799.1 hypothetical protein [Candidatus Woesebacteria bacterium]